MKRKISSLKKVLLSSFDFNISSISSILKADVFTCCSVLHNDVVGKTDGQPDVSIPLL